MEFREEMRYEYPLAPDSVVLDCGGYEGRWAAGIHERYGCTVHVLEPVKRFYQQIVQRFAGNDKIHVYNLGIGGRSETVLFFIKGDMTGAYAENPDADLVHLEAADSLLRMLDIVELDVLKLNIEGGEWEVIPRLIETGEIKRVKNLQVQWHNVGLGNRTMFDELQVELTLTHHLTFDAGWVWQNWERNA